MRNDTNFRTGNIYRICMTNFLTYDKVEVFPKPYLNVIIGPNGTGKSSLLCGICIGLSGKPELTGRGKVLAEYIKQGKDNAIIEIELVDNEHQTNTIIRRMFTGQASKWYLQDREVKQKDIEAKVASLGIQVNNLCQFLPQDRVVEFAKMNKIQRLSSTEMAVGEKELYEHHQILSNSGKVIQEQKEALKDLSNQLETEVKKNNLLKDQVQNIHRKEDLDKEITELNQLIFYCKYNHRRSKFVNTQTQLDRIIKQCKLLANEREPYNLMMSKVESDLKHCSNQQKEYCKRGHEVCHPEIKQLARKMLEKEEEISVVGEEYSNLVISNQKREKEIKELERQLDVAHAQLQAARESMDEDLIKEQRASVEKNVQMRSQTLNTIYEKITRVETELRTKNVMVDEYQRKLNNIPDVKAARLQKLNFRNRHVNNAVIWLKENRNKFKAFVHDPIFLTVEFIHPSYAKYLENTVSMQDLIAFVCEDRYDVQTLKEKADFNKWPINILHSTPIPPEKYKPQYPQSTLKSYGFDAYIKDVLEAPDAVVSYLCRIYNIHNIPFAENQISTERVSSEFSLYFVGNSCYRNKVSRYDKEVSTLVSEIRPAVLLAISANREQERKLQEALKNEKQYILTLEKTCEQIRSEENQLETELEKLREDERAFTKNLKNRRRLEETVKVKQQLLEAKERIPLNLSILKQNTHAKIKKITLDMLSIAKQHSQLEEQITKLNKEAFQKCITYIDLTQQKRKIKEELKAVEKRRRESEEEKNKLELQKSEHETAAKNLLRELYLSLGLMNYNQITYETKQDFANKLRQTTLEELENNYAEKMAQSKCIITCDNSVLEQYKNRELKIAEFSKKEEQILKFIQKQSMNTEVSKEFWLSKITQLITKINSHFAEFMAKLDCAGEVQLDTGTDLDDFSQYGLSIRVKFRDCEKLQELTATQQSGGERSVSTALFLMSLQTLTAVPFRCVDEINQGMDPTNERKMFTMLVNSTTTENASQYFLVTPKLLPNLPYNHRVNFMNIANWYSQSGRSLNVAKALANYKKKSQNKGPPAHAMKNK